MTPLSMDSMTIVDRFAPHGFQARGEIGGYVFAVRYVASSLVKIGHTTSPGAHVAVLAKMLGGFAEPPSLWQFGREQDALAAKRAVFKLFADVAAGGGFFDAPDLERVTPCLLELGYERRDGGVIHVVHSSINRVMHSASSRDL